MSEQHHQPEASNENNSIEKTDKHIEITKEQIDRLIQQIENDLGKDI